MIRKVVQFIFRITLCFLMLVPYVLEPFAMEKVNAASSATTIAGLKEELAKLKQQKANNTAKKNQTQSEINENNAAVKAAKQEQESNYAAVEEAENKITESNEKIAQTTADLETLMKYYQIADNDNIYLDYITGSQTPTEFVMRVEAVNQISSYYHNKITEMKDLIEENEQLKIDLANKNTELDASIAKTTKLLDSLYDDLESYNDINEDIDSQISNQQKLIDYYKTVCTSETQLLTDCVKVAASTGWAKPLTYGVINSPRGYRGVIIAGTSSYHNGADIGGNKEGTPVYAPANGTVAAITDGKAQWQKTGTRTCGGIRVYIHVFVNGKAYTVQFAHLLTYNVKVGDVVTPSTVVGTVGGGSQEQKWDYCSTGAHLHYAVSTGYYLGGGTYGYSSWSKFIANSIDPPGIPTTKGARWTSR